jgi:hypothetical protein
LSAARVRRSLPLQRGMLGWPGSIIEQMKAIAPLSDRVPRPNVEAFDFTFG